MAHPPLSIDDLHAMDRVGGLALSPDGAQLACTVTRGDMAANRTNSALWLLPVQGQVRPRRLTTCGERDGAPAWSPRGDRIAFLAKRTQDGETDKTAQLYLIAPDGGEARRASRFAPGMTSFRWMPDGRRVLFAAWTWPDLKGAAAQAKHHQAFVDRKETGYATGEALYRHWDQHLPQGRVLHLWLLDVDSGRAVDLFEGTALELPRTDAGAAAYAPHPDGRSVAFVHDPDHPPRPAGRWALSALELRSRRVRTLVDDPAWDLGAPAWRPDGRALAFTAAPIGQRHTALNRLAMIGDDDRWRCVSPVDWGRDVDGPLRWTADGSAVLFGAEERGRRHLWRCDLAGGGITRVFAGGWLQSFDSQRDQVVVAADSALHPPRVLALGAGAGEAATPRRLERFNDALLSRRRLGVQREVTVTGAQGDPVQLWLTFPPGVDPDRPPKKKLPVLHVLHGGPYSAAGDSFSLRWNVHVLASRGHVVAQVNFHGSSGFGFAFRDSIMGRQGELELQDIEAASDWLLRQPWADATRLDASGGSYGGFLVAWMNGHATPGRYRRMVCHAGVFDRVATFSADSFLHRPRDLGAFYWDDMAKVLAQSPHAAAGRMATPTLVIHGAKDYRVPDCNGLAYYNTLQARGVEARLLWFADENHWILKPRNARQWTTEFLDWIAPRQRSARASG